VALTATEARFGLAVENSSAHPLPHGIGLHPWFPRTPRTTLKFRARSELLLGPDMRATSVTDIRPTHDFSTGRLLPVDEDLVISAVDWDGTAEIRLPEQGLTIQLTASDTLRHPVIWAPRGSDFLCFEPQSHAIGAPSEPLVQTITPMRVLETGEALAGWMAIVVKRS
jgi:aldose 1-epimerase